MFQQIFEEISSSNHIGTKDVELLNELVEILRVENENSISKLSEFLVRYPKLAKDFNRFIIELISQTEQIGLFVDSGIAGKRTLLSAISTRIGEKILPQIRDNTFLGDLIDGVFDSDEDLAWLGAITEKQWVDLLVLIEVSKFNTDIDLTSEYELLRKNITKALSIVAYKITGLSLEREVVDAYPLESGLESPFIALNQEIQMFIENYDKYYSEFQKNTRKYPDEDHIYVMVEQCTNIVKSIKRNARTNGITISLTNTLLRIEQYIERVLNLLDLVNVDNEIRYKAIGKLLFTITDHQHNQKKIRTLLRKNTELLSRQVTENASKTGEQYITTDSAGYWSMYRKAAGAGLIIAFMAALKIILSKFVLAPIGRAFINSMNYGLGFMYIHVLHWKVATKQPAMTAATLASTIEEKDTHNNVKLICISKMTVDIFRTQFIAIIGNISITMPVTILLCYFYTLFSGEALITTHKAEKLLHDIDPIRSLSLFHAAIAGVCLFLSGLIAGYYDNKAVYRKIGLRIQAHQGINRLLGKNRAAKFSTYIENNLGALAGNFWFGVMLGSMGTLGYILGLPIDIKHIAFSSANLVHGLFYIDQLPNIFTIIYLFVGVLLIGLFNLLVSFSLALFVALRARNVSFKQWAGLYKQLLFSFFTQPLDFFWPRKK